MARLLARGATAAVAAVTAPVTGISPLVTPSALANSAAVENRSAGVRASALFTAAWSEADTASRTAESGRGVSVSARAMIAWALGPLNGGSPASSSYRTQPRA